MDWRLLLAHHPPAEYHRCVRIGRLHLCARCLGMYPAMFAGLAIELVLQVHHPAALLARPWETWALIGLMSPASVDFIWGRLDPSRGKRGIGLATGVLLGLGLARTIYLNARTPLSGPGFQALGFLTLIVVFGILATRRA